jgi:hypothetical protein
VKVPDDTLPPVLFDVVGVVVKSDEKREAPR